MSSTRKISAALFVSALVAATLGVGFKTVAGMGHAEEMTVYAGIVPAATPSSAEAEEQPPTF